MDNWIMEKDLPNITSKSIANEVLENPLNLGYVEQTIGTQKRIYENSLLDQAKDNDYLDLDGIFEWLNARDGARPSTINQIFGVLRRYIKYSQDTGYIRKFPDKSLEDEHAKLHSTFLSLNDRAIVKFLLSSGCRHTEYQLMENPKD